MIAYTGGKTAGHIMPLISVISESDKDSLYIGFEGYIEEKICINKNIKFIGIKEYPNKMKSILLGYFYLKKVLSKYKITAVLSSGGYVSLPLCMYAVKKKIPLYLLEANVILGSVNKLLYPYCIKIFSAYELNLNKCVLTGLPIRKYSLENCNEIYDILVIGGSLGSKILCEVAVRLKNKYKVLLIAGRYYDDFKKENDLEVIEFSNDIYSLMKKSKMIIARAGGSTSIEIFNINKPFLCIPSMNTKKNHQYLNAMYFKEKGACFVCLESEIKTDLFRKCDILLNNQSVRINMLDSQKNMCIKDSSKRILEEIK